MSKKVAKQYLQFDSMNVNFKQTTTVSITYGYICM